jgi:hypothetical protein
MHSAILVLELLQSRNAKVVHRLAFNALVAVGCERA